MTFHFRQMTIGAALVVLTGCTLPADVDAPQVAMGDFRFGHNIVVVDEPEIGPLSRTQTDEAWQEALTNAMDLRFGGYEGEKFYHIGMKMDAYVLALPGVPIVFKPKSVLVVTVNMWDDAAGEKVNEEAKVFTIFEGVSGETLISSGLLQNKQQQMVKLANNAAKAVQDWILENPEWIGLPPLSDEPVPETDVLDQAEAITQTTIDDASAN
ncbi:MAG: hypothetical protein ACU0C9_00165 [Paracoccaceae bacterium]